MSDRGQAGPPSTNGVQKIEPLATTRTRRSNAGNLMGHLIQEEEDDFYNNLYGGFQDEEDDVDFNSDEEGVAEDDEGDGSSDGDSESSLDDSDSDGPDIGDDDRDQRTEKGAAAKSKPDGDNKNRSNCKKPTSNKSRSAGKSRPSRSKKSLAQQTIAEFIKEEEQPEIKFQFKEYARICSVCLSAQSDEDDEIIECDSCGVTVHESCYGVVGDDAPEDVSVSVKSNHSSASTEPWFCEPCTRSIHKPHCELCPNTGGIFKETDTGRWVHMVCALYTRGVTFENIHNLTDVSLFEINYNLYGSKVSL